MKLIEDELIIQALREDISSEDITTNAIVDKDCIGKVDLICKQDGIIAGLEVFKRVFELLDDGTEIETKFKEGDSVKEGDLVAVVHAKARALLTGERTALNFLQRMSGIATHTRELVKELEGTNTKLLDTRKTTPNMRIFEKYAVRVGGGQNHRFNLSDGVLIKDNHIGAAGSIKKAVELARNYAPFVRKEEVEVENLDMVQEALEAKVDIIMLDNMDIETMKKAVEIIGDRAKTECSGNVTKDRLAKIAEIGVDYVSSGALTHSSLTLDFSMKNLEILGDS